MFWYERSRNSSEIEMMLFRCKPSRIPIDRKLPIDGARMYDTMRMASNRFSNMKAKNCTKRSRRAQSIVEKKKENKIIEILQVYCFRFSSAFSFISTWILHEKYNSTALTAIPKTR